MMTARQQTELLDAIEAELDAGTYDHGERLADVSALTSTGCTVEIRLRAMAIGNRIGDGDRREHDQRNRRRRPG